jgi:hypothetical protein
MNCFSMRWFFPEPESNARAAPIGEWMAVSDFVALAPLFSFIKAAGIMTEQTTWSGSPQVHVKTGDSVQC